MKAVTVGEAGRRKYPEWLTLVVTTDAAGRPNAMTAGWCMWTSGRPPMLAVSVGLTRYTHELIEARKEFVLAFPGRGQGPGTLAVGSASGRDVPDKLAQAGFSTVPATKVNVPLIAGAAANFECRLAAHLRTGDHTIFVGEVLAAHVEDPAVERLVNFGGVYAVAEPILETVFRV
jgi:flavin reductase (DIM6/NTAB) family NADH-FMN oxidoreductase RutF